MIKAYNGKVNRRILSDLQRLCDVAKENRATLLEKFNQDGEVSFYENLDFFGLPDELSSTKTLTTIDEIEGYSKENFNYRLEGYISYKKPITDCLTVKIINFIRESNGVYPTPDEMKELEKQAEIERKAKLTESESKIDMKQLIINEILQLAEEIIESRRVTNPSDVSIHVEPYPDTLEIITDDFGFYIRYYRYFGSGDSTDYSLAVRLYKHNYGKIEFSYAYDIDHPFIVKGDKIYHANDISNMAYIIEIHKAISDIARKEGIEFTTEVDYDMLPKK